MIYWNNPKQNATGSSKFAPTGEEGIFLGYHVQPGFIFKKEYLVTPVKGAREAIQDSNFKILRAKRMEVPDGDFMYPLQNDESQDPPPNLDDQNCFSQTEDKLPDDLDDEEHKDLFELLGIGEGEASPPRGEAVSDQGGGEALDQGGSIEEPSGSKSIPKVKPMPVHDPKIMPSGKPCPPGFNWDGVRLVRNKKGSKRPPDTPSEFWHMYSAKQREEDIARYKRKVELEEERIRKEREEAAPAMPVMHGNVPEPHREKMFRLYWEKLGEVTDLQLALVARVVSQAEVERTPAAKAAMDKEWQKLVDKSCWLEKKVREFQDVTAEAKRSNKKAHFGRIFEICSQKGSELPPGHPDQKWKGRSVFQGNRVQDEHNDHAIFLLRLSMCSEANQDTPNSRRTPGRHTRRHCSKELRPGYGSHEIAGRKNGRSTKTQFVL